jgi:hypothetical protein
MRLIIPFSHGVKSNTDAFARVKNRLHGFDGLEALRNSEPWRGMPLSSRSWLPLIVHLSATRHELIRRFSYLVYMLRVDTGRRGPTRCDRSELDCKPSVSAVRPVLSVKFSIPLEFDVGLHGAKGNDVAELWAILTTRDWMQRTLSPEPLSQPILS